MQFDPIIRAVLNAIQEDVLVIDAQERIVYGNRVCAAFLEKEVSGLIGLIEGCPLWLLRLGTWLPKVSVQKRSILHIPHQESEDIYLVSTYPIFDGAEVMGGLSVVAFQKDAFDFRAELKRYEKHSRQAPHRVNKASAAHYTFDSIVAVSSRSATYRRLTSRLAQTDVIVPLQLESDTGKGLYVWTIHNANPRSTGVLVVINCVSFSTDMPRSELSGYTKGALIGAKWGRKIDLFEVAAGGILFLDEIPEMDVGLQSKLLCAPQERRVWSVGGVREVETDAHVIAACNADLPHYTEGRKLHTDLFYYLNTFPIHVPPLWERREDIPLLCHSLLGELSRKLKRHLELTPEALDCPLTHSQPGNIRELCNVLEFYAYLTPSDLVIELSLPENFRTAPAVRPLTLAQRTRVFEEQEILRLLTCNGSHLEGKGKTVAQFGIPLVSLYNKLNGPF